MKRRIIIIIVSVLALFALVALIIPKDIYSKWFGNNELNKNVSEFNLLVYVRNDKNQIVGVNVPVSNLEEDQIRQKWNIMTTNCELIPEGFTSVLSKDIVLNEYSIDYNTLKLDVSSEIYNASKNSLEALVWTFVNEDINDIELYVDGKIVSEVSDYEFTKLNKKMGINYTYETMHLYDSIATTLVFQEDNYILPVTYFHLNDDVCDYIVMKILNNIDSNAYDYKLENSVLTIDFVDASILSTNQIASISESIALNFDINSLNINNNENIFYQRVFKDMTETN